LSIQEEEEKQKNEFNFFQCLFLCAVKMLNEGFIHRRLTRGEAGWREQFKITRDLSNEN